MKFNNLNQKAKRMLFSILLASIAGVVVDLFLNAYLWRELRSIEAIAIYNLGTIITLPIFFYINGLILKKTKVAQMYSFGLIGRSIVIALIVFASELTDFRLLIFGLLYGVFNAFFWANRNYLSLKVTTDNDRIYYSAIESILGTFTNILIPLIIGWFIVFTDKAELGTSFGYRIIMGLGLIIAAIAGFLVFSIDVPHPKFIKSLRFKKNSTWVSFRITTFIEGLINGVMFFLPILIILNMIGEEGILGTLTAISSIITALLVFIIGKKAQYRHRKLLMYMSILLLIFASLFFSVNFSKSGAIIYRLVESISVSLYWVIWSPVYYELIDKQDHESDSMHYAYVVDTEIFLNIGRIIGIFIVLISLSIMSENQVLRFVPAILAITQIPAIYYFKKIFKEL